MSEDLSAFAKKRKTKKIRRFVFLGVLLALLLGTAAYFALENYFVVKEISIKKSTLYQSEELSEVLAIEKGTPLYQLEKKKLVGAVEENFPYLVNVKISYKLPDKVQITYDEEFGELALTMGTELFAVDRELNVLAKEPGDSQIARIRLISSDVKRCIVGEKLTFIDEDTAEILVDLMDQLEKEELFEGTGTIDVSDPFDIRLDYDGKFQVLLGDHTDLNLKFSMVREVIKDLGPNASGRIDIADPDNAYVKLNESDS